MYRQSSKALGDAGVYHHTVVNGVEANNTTRSEAYYVGQVLTFRGYASGTATNDATNIPFTINLQPGSGNRVTMTSFDCQHCKGAGISASSLPYSFGGKFTFKPGQTYTNELVYTMTFRIDALSSEQPVMSGFLDAPVAGGSAFYKGAIATFTRVTPTAARQVTPPTNPSSPAAHNDPIDDIGDGSLGLPQDESGSAIDNSYYATGEDGVITAEDLQGTKKQPTIEPSPFFDGKQYTPGSSVLASLRNGKTGIMTSWPVFLGGVATIGVLGAGAYYWYVRRKRL